MRTLSQPQRSCYVQYFVLWHTNTHEAIPMTNEHFLNKLFSSSQTGSLSLQYNNKTNIDIETCSAMVWKYDQLQIVHWNVCKRLYANSMKYIYIYIAYCIHWPDYDIAGRETTTSDLDSSRASPQSGNTNTGWLRALSRHGSNHVLLQHVQCAGEYSWRLRAANISWSPCSVTACSCSAGPRSVSRG